eukprot:COSAG02_NODE_12540_length_1528_cov_1.557033_2_plen_30_part_01
MIYESGSRELFILAWRILDSALVGTRAGHR